MTDYRGQRPQYRAAPPAPHRRPGYDERGYYASPPRRQPAPRPVPRVGDPGRRQGMATVLAILVLGVFAGRLVMIQGVHAAELSNEALSQRLVTAEIPVHRADIVDRNGVVLATSVDRYHIWVDQVDVRDFKRVQNGVVVAEGPLGAAQILAPILGMSEAELGAALIGDSHFVYLVKDMPVEVWQQVRDERITGIDAEPTSERLYPNGNVAGNVIGFVGGRSDIQGSWGIAGVEYAFEDYLLGTPGTVTYERGGGNTVIPTGIRSREEAIAGQDVVLTIDRDIQYRTQALMDEAIRNSGASGGAAVIMDAQTGQVYALVDSRAVDPANPGASAEGDRGSRAISSVFEPGSTAKIITVAAAINEGIATPLSRYVAPYEYTTANGQTFHDSHEHDDQQLTLAGVLVTSSNTGTIKVGQQLDPETRYDYMRAFGLGETTDVGLAGESAGILHPYEQWDGRTKYAVLFGQGVSVTALQTTQVFATIANGGVLQPPTLVAGFRSDDGTFTPREVAASRRVVSEETAAQVMLMLEAVVAEGTGTLAQVPGYRIAGKTGTAQAADENGELNSVVASFVGIAPADNPRLVITVILYDPKSSIWGGDVAAPVFADIAAFALQSLGIAPSGDTAELYPTTWE